MEKINRIKISLFKKLLKLSRREGDVLVLVMEGKMTKEIANELHLSQRTVENHRHRIRKKLSLPKQNNLREWINSRLKGLMKS